MTNLSTRPEASWSSVIYIDSSFEQNSLSFTLLINGLHLKQHFLQKASITPIHTQTVLINQWVAAAMHRTSESEIFDLTRGKFSY